MQGSRPRSSRDRHPRRTARPAQRPRRRRRTSSRRTTASHPDPADAGPAGRLRHLRPPRVEPRRRLQRGPHPRHHAGDLRVPRASRASTARCSSAATRTRCRSRRGSPRWRCSPPTTSPCSSTPRDRYTPTPALSPRDPARTTAGHARPRARRRHRRHAVAQPAARRRLQVQPAARRAGRHRRHRVDRGPRQRAARRRPRRRATAVPLAPGPRRRPRDVRLPRRLRRRPARVARPRRRPRRRACASAPTRSAAPASTTGAPSRERHGLDLTVVNPARRPARGAS